MSVKLYRHKIILKLISSNEISNQEELLEKLKHHRIEATQATLSRDLKELKITKVPNDKGKYIYKVLESEKKQNEILALEGQTLNFSGSLAVLKTRPGYANGIAAELDKNLSQEIIGTVAGDDTVMIVLNEKTKREQIKKSIKNLIPNIKILP